VGKKHSEKTKKKMSETRSGEKSPRWKGGRYIDYRGHVYIYSPKHPNINSRNYIRESRLIAEKALGRYLNKNEEVHHINKNSSDNRNCNLLICTKSYHAWLHRRIAMLQKEG